MDNYNRTQFQQPFVVPDVDGRLPSTSQPLRVPDTVSGENIQSIPDWTYKKFGVFDILHSKLGIAASTAILTFVILAYVNPPFVQEKGQMANEIQTKKPSFKAIYGISIAVFLFLFVVPVNPKPKSNNI